MADKEHRPNSYTGSIELILGWNSQKNDVTVELFLFSWVVQNNSHWPIMLMYNCCNRIYVHDKCEEIWYTSVNVLVLSLFISFTCRIVLMLSEHGSNDRPSAY